MDQKGRILSGAKAFAEEHLDVGGMGGRWGMGVLRGTSSIFRSPTEDSVYFRPAVKMIIRLLKYFLPPITAFFAVTVFYFGYIDREPPFKRISGELVPDTVPFGGCIGTDDDGNPALLPCLVRVRYVTTKRIPGREEQCPGDVQQEVWSNRQVFSNLLPRTAGPASWEPHPTDPDLEIFTGHPVAIPINAEPDPKALFKTNSFRGCNFLQQWEYWPNAWKVIQRGPDIVFTISPKRMLGNQQ